MTMIKITDRDGSIHLISPASIARIVEPGASSQWHGIKSFIKTFDGTTIECGDDVATVKKKIDAVACQSFPTIRLTRAQVVDLLASMDRSGLAHIDLAGGWDAASIAWEPSMTIRAITEPLELRAGRTYRAKHPSNCRGLVNDRTIVEINDTGQVITYAGPAVKVDHGRFYTKVNVNAFIAWASHDVTAELDMLTPGKYAPWPLKKGGAT